MGMTANLLILMLIMSYAFYAGTPNHESSIFFSLVGIQGDEVLLYPNGTIITMESRVDDIIFNLGAVVALITGVGVVAYLFGKVEPMMAIWGAFVLFLITFVALPINVFTSASIPIEIKLLLYGVYGFMMIFGILDFYKGTGGLS